MVGITGSVGKTTVKELTAAMLAPLGSTAFTRGNWNNDLGLPLSLLEMGAADRFGVFEMGMNHPGELDPLCRLLAPAWGIMTPVGLAHSEAFACERDIVTEKASLFRALPEQGGAVLSRDQKWYAELAAEAGCPVVTTSLAGDADFRGRVVAPGRFEVTEAATSETASFDIPAPGRFMVENALLAIALARRLGGSWDALGAALAAYRPMPMRWEESSVGGARVINDAYNANPMSMRASADALAALTGGGRKWLVLAGMFELGSAEEAEHVELGRYLAGGPWAGLLVVGRLGGLIADGAEAAGLAPARVVRCGNHEEAAESLRAMVQAGDVVLLKGSRGEHLEHILEHFPADRQTS
jgi:UDP-N-acetylmuramoyl-tripeptide--D-alanyl-D-alanine ligase